MKVFLGTLVFTVFSLVNLHIASAETNNNNYDTIAITADNEFDQDEVMSAIAGRSIADGDSFIVDNKYRLDCEVSLTPAISSGITINSVTNSYNATCTVYVTSLFSSTHVATIYHSVNITYNDSGLVHINSGSLSVSPAVSWFTGAAYGYSITNTNGSYSSASGMVELYDSMGKSYYYYNASVSVSGGSDPVFNFTKQ